MEIIPAVDLRGGKCVRLYQGDYHKETVYSEDPVSMACHWESLGARRLHVVDLDGAARGDLCHIPAIKGIIRAVQIPVQVGGGVRRLDTVEQLLEMGANRVILGTLAVDDPELVKQACKMFGEDIVVSLDAQEGYIRSHGWLKITGLPAVELALKMESLGVRRFIYTDIARDGTLAGPDFEAIARFKAQTHNPLIVAGGISRVEHLWKLAEMGVEGAILGQALYSGSLNLPDLLGL